MEESVSSRIPTCGNSWDDGTITIELKQIKELKLFQSREMLKGSLR